RRRARREGSKARPGKVHVSWGPPKWLHYMRNPGAGAREGSFRHSRGAAKDRCRNRPTPVQYYGSVAKGDTYLTRRFDDVAVDRHDSSLTNRFTYRQRFHVRRHERYHTSKSALPDQTRSSRAKPRAEHSIETGRWASALKMAKHDDPRFFAGQFGNNGGYTLTHSPETSLATRGIRFGVDGLAALLEGAFGDNDDTEMFTQAFTHDNRLDDLCRIVRNLGDQNDIRSSCNSRVHRNPPGMPPHDLDDHHPAMTLSCCVQFIQCVASCIHGRVKTKCKDGAPDIVINRLRNTNNRNALFVKSFCDGKCSVAADHDERIEAELLEIRNDGIGNVPGYGRSAVVERGIREGICGISSAKNRAAEMKNAGHTGLGQRPGLKMHKTVKTFFDSKDFPSEANGSFDSSPDNGI